jgi:hypothetical protein
MASMLASLIAVLALAGAPASTHVYCDPAIPAVELGAAYPSSIQVIDGRVILGTLDNIELGTGACGALLYTSASPAERSEFRRLNSSVNFDQLVGVGLQVVLHEANHVALNSTDECLVEKTTRLEVGSLLERYADHASAAEAAATASDASLPAAYRGC